MNSLLQTYQQRLDYVSWLHQHSKLVIDPVAGTLTTFGASGPVTIGLYAPAAFRELSRLWVQVGWSLGYYFNFTWMGLPVLQLPEDLLRLQEAVFTVRPDLIIETGIAGGGSLLYLASLCRILGTGRLIGIDIYIAPQVRAALTSSSLSPYITLIEGNSTSREVFDQVTQLHEQNEKVMVILDSDHSKAHVRAELELYAPLVTPGSYIIAEDGIMRDLCRVPGGAANWFLDNPAAAARDFLAVHPEFRHHQPNAITDFGATPVSYWTEGWLQRIKSLSS